MWNLVIKDQFFIKRSNLVDTGYQLVIKLKTTILKISLMKFCIVTLNTRTATCKE